MPSYPIVVATETHKAVNQIAQSLILIQSIAERKRTSSDYGKMIVKRIWLSGRCNSPPKFIDVIFLFVNKRVVYQVCVTNYGVFGKRRP